MDDHFRRRKQNENQMRPPSDPRYQQPGQEASQQRHFHPGGPAASDRQRLAPGGGRVMAGGGSSSGGYGSGYYQESPEGAFPAGSGVSHGAMGYAQAPTEYAHDGRQAQGFAGGYNTSSAGMMYGVQQTGGQDPVFGTTQSSFASRQHGGMQMVATDVAPAPYFGGDSAAGTAAVAMHAQGTQSSGPSTSVYQHQGASDSRASVVGGYGSGMGVGLTATGGLAQQPVGGPNPESGSTAAAASARDYADTHESYAAYQRSLKDIFKNIKSGSLAPASESLLSISDWLLSRVEPLGLTVDDEELYGGRVKLWQNFNHAWMGLLEKQKEMVWSGKKLHRSQSLVSLEDLQKMARELIRLCDGIERFGLVDYDYGVWEERIMAVLTECVDLYGMAEEEATGAASGSSSHQG